MAPDVSHIGLNEEEVEMFKQDWQVAMKWATELTQQAVTHSHVSPRQAILGTLIAYFSLCNLADLSEYQIAGLFDLVGQSRPTATEH